MILAIDIGNTNIVIGCIKDDKILFTERMSTDSNETVLEYAIGFKTVLELYHIHTKDLTGSIISSVVPPVTNTIKEALFKITHHQAMVVGPGIRTGLNILTDNPAVTGSDLIVGAVAAIHEYPVPLIIFDFGTATTASVVDRKKNYIGGMIIPGIRVSLDGLASHASQLSRISLDAPKKIIGTNTTDDEKVFFTGTPPCSTVSWTAWKKNLVNRPQSSPPAVSRASSFPSARRPSSSMIISCSGD